MKNSFDLVLLLTYIFGIDQGWKKKSIYTIFFSWVYRALNFSLISMILYQQWIERISETKGIMNVINSWTRDIYVLSLVTTILVLQARKLFRINETDRIERAVSHNIPTSYSTDWSDYIYLLTL